MRIITLLSVLLLASCAGNPEAKGFLKTLEFDDDECGCFRGSVNVAPTLWTGTSVVAVLHKRKTCPGEESAPSC